MMEEHQARLRRVATVAEAIAVAKERRPDIFLVDLWSARDGGLGVLRSLVTNESLAQIPVFMVATMANGLRKQSLGEAIHLGASDVIFKPIDTILLAEKIRVFMRLRELSQQQHAFYNLLTKDLNGPLQTITGFSSLVMSGRYGAGNEGDVRGALELISAAAEKLKRQIQHFTQYTRIESGRLKFNFLPVDLMPLLKGAVESVRTLPLNGHVEIRWDVPPTLPRILVDEMELTAALSEFFRDCFAKHESESAPLGIRLVHHDEEETIELCVTVAGFGMTEDEVSRLFDVQYNISQPSSTRDGLGIGLALLKAIVEGHGGSISVVSDVGFSTTFVLQLPLFPPGVSSDPGCV